MKEIFSGKAMVQSDISEFLLEYYLIEDNNKNYGIRIEKTEKMGNKLVLKEDYTSEYGIDSEANANAVLEMLMKNKVTPTTADCVLHDLGYFE